MDELNLTICCRYVESLVENPRISKYLGKHHPTELVKLRNLLDEFEKACETQQET